MGDLSPSINITSDAIEYCEQKFLSLFGKDNQSIELASWFKGLQQTAQNSGSELFVNRSETWHAA